jgi:hypothetical protein
MKYHWENEPNDMRVFVEPHVARDPITGIACEPQCEATSPSGARCEFQLDHDGMHKAILDYGRTREDWQ